MKYTTIALMMLVPLSALAAEPVRLADTRNQPRFFALDSARSGLQPTVKVKQNPKLATKRALRSDAAAMNNGFFRLDRRTTAPTAPPHALIIKPGMQNRSAATEAPLIIRGAAEAINTPDNPDPVLSLFNNNGAAPLPSFRDALTGAAGVGAPAGSNVHNWPLPASASQKISSVYGYRPDPLNKRMQFHSGIDIAASTGTPVLASADGRVSRVATDALYGQSISILHSDGSESQYGHLSRQLVTVGQQVKAGQEIGAVGATGRVTGAHLDYRISRNGVTIDPMKMLAHPGTIRVAENDTHAHPASPESTRPKIAAKSQRLIVVH